MESTTPTIFTNFSWVIPLLPPSSSNQDWMSSALSALTMSGENTEAWLNADLALATVLNHEKQIKESIISPILYLRTCVDYFETWSKLSDFELKTWREHFLQKTSENESAWFESASILLELLENVTEQKHVHLLRSCYYSMMRMYVVEQMTSSTLNEKATLFLKLYGIFGPAFALQNAKKHFLEARLSFLLEIEKIPFTELAFFAKASLDSNIQEFLILLLTLEHNFFNNNHLASVKTLSQLLEKYPHNLWLLFKRAQYHIWIGEVKKAQADEKESFNSLHATVIINPCHPFALVLRGIFYARNSQQELALADFNNALMFDPMNVPALCEKFRLIKDQINESDALTYVRDLYKLDSKNPLVLTLFAEALLKKELFEDALELINRALLSDPLYPTSYMIKGHLLVKMKRFKEAMTNINCAIGFFPASVAFKNLKVSTLRIQGQYKEALKEVDKIGKIDGMLYLELAFCKLGLKDKASALEYAHLALNQYPGNSSAMQVITQALQLP